MIAVVAFALLVWRCHGSSSSTSAARTETPSLKNATSTRPDDLSTLSRGAIAGVVTDEGKTPITGAHVCARGENDALPPELVETLHCAVTDARGRYELRALPPAVYAVSGSARAKQPATQSVRLPDSSTVTADLQLRAGGVELSGVVLDVGGGPIAQARVVADGAVGETDPTGTFTLWVRPASLDVLTSADGYADRSTYTSAPGHVRIMMTPASSLAGVVVDAASGEPVANARVEPAPLRFPGHMNPLPRAVLTDAEGRFRIGGLVPGRYAAVARSERGYGRSATAAALGLGESVDGIIVELHPAVRIDGAVVHGSTRKPCEAAKVTLTDNAKERRVVLLRALDGKLWADGVLPGTYTVDVQCADAFAKAPYDPIVVADRPLEVVWEVEPGAVIEGRVATRSGQPLADVQVSAKTFDQDKEGYGRTRTKHDGSFTIRGLRPGKYRLYALAESALRLGANAGPEVDLRSNMHVRVDVTLEDAGTLRGRVVDRRGKPVARCSVQAVSRDETWTGDARSDERGEFTMRGLPPGEYTLEFRQRVTIRANEIATATVVYDPPSASIHGTVVDHRGKPVGDAYLTTDTGIADSKFWRSPSHPDPVITKPDGSFTISGLHDQTYDVLAYRQTGEEGVVENVRAGSTVQIRIPAAAAITGVVRRGGAAVDEFKISAVELESPDPLWRYERFFRTDGRFRVEGLPSRRYRVTASAEGSQAQQDVELAAGETESITFDLDPLVTITGRVVLHPDGSPVAGIMMRASVPRGAETSVRAVTDNDGRFTIRDAPRGTVVELHGYRGTIEDHLHVVRSIAGPTDVGTLQLVRRPYAVDDKYLGFKLAPIRDDVAPDRRALIVASIDPRGPAARTELRVGDEITAIDGLDVTGGNTPMASYLKHGPPGSTARVTVKRGVTIEITR